jgi:2-oxoglutarate ferredoxin oxidoreductase subunit alpha
VPFKKILSDLKGQPVMKNTIAMGAGLAILGSDLLIINEILEKQFLRKGQEVIDFNKKFAQLGHDHVKQNFSQHIKQDLAKRESEQKLVMSGNDAFSLASTIADCRIYCAYPMTPSSTVLTTMASWSEKTGIIVRHAEDEISVINTALGASFAGVRAAVGTSGGGFALMVESVSFAGVAEMPIVIFLSQRAGPATGMPTWTEQGDLLFAVHAGHGEFPKIVLAPGDVEEMVNLTAKAFNLADIYQTPVIVMSDMFLSESHKTLAKKFIDEFALAYKIDRGKTVIASTEQKYLRYRVTDDGISERLIPGQKGFFYQANSYEHIEDGHTTEEAQPRKSQVDKRNKKSETYLRTHFVAPKVFGELEKSKTVFVAWGSMKGPILEAQKILKERGTETAFLSFTHLYPMNRDMILPLFNEARRYILVENNSQAQFGKLLLMETGIEIKEKLLKYDGRPFWPEEIAQYVNSKF